MKIKKEKIIDLIIYVIFCVVFTYDFLSCLFKDKSIFIVLSFFIIGVLCFIGFIRDKGFVSIDTMIYIFMFMFAYYAPLHQYIRNVNIHKYEPFTDFEYLYGNIMVFLFLVSYMLTRKYLKYKTKRILFIKEREFQINDYSAIILMGVCLACLVWLYLKHEIFTFSSIVVDDSNTVNDTLSGIVIRIVRFFPAATIFLYISALKRKTFNSSKFIKYCSITLVGIVFMIVFNPVGGTMNRYILFGTFVMLLASCFENCKHKSYIIFAAIVGFYFIFPAFNFFKYNSFSNISQFQWGGFDVNSNDYDSYQVMLQAIRYVDTNGIMWGKNIISALLCIIPRRIWRGKMFPSGQIVAEAINARFTNLSCPLFAEFYLAFGIIGVAIGAILFANLIKIIEYGKQRDNCYYRGIYYITIGIMISYMRGAMLPVTSFWYCWIISFSCAYFICKGLRGGRR